MFGHVVVPVALAMYIDLPNCRCRPVDKVMIGFASQPTKEVSNESSAPARRLASSFGTAR